MKQKLERSVGSARCAGRVGWGLTVCLCVWAGWMVSASAQQDSSKRRSGPRVIQLEEIQIEGRVQKPNAFYILNRSNIGFQDIDLKTSFVREVVKSVDARPF